MKRSWQEWAELFKQDISLVKIYPYPQELSEFKYIIASGLATLKDEKQLIDIISYIAPHIKELNLCGVDATHLIEVFLKVKPEMRIRVTRSDLDIAPLTFEADNDLVNAHIWLYKFAEVGLDTSDLFKNRTTHIGIPVVEKIYAETSKALGKVDKMYQKVFVEVLVREALEHNKIITAAIETLLQSKQLCNYIPKDTREEFAMYLIRVAALPWIDKFISKENVLRLVECSISS